jgi:DNA-binding NtrC family response regulator
MEESSPANVVALGTAEAEENIALGIGVDLKRTLRGAEASMIRTALGQAKGDVLRAAKLLHIPRTTLYEKMRRYGI